MGFSDMVQRTDTDIEDSWNVNATCYANRQETVEYEELNIDIALFEMNTSTTSRQLPTRFPWTEGQISLINAAYFVGYVPAIVPGVIIAGRMGFYNYIAVMLFATCFLLATFPAVTSLMGLYGAGISRLLLGAIHAPATSVVSGQWYYWCLRSDITTTNSIWQIGGAIGMITVGGLGGTLLTVGYHWPSMYELLFLVKLNKHPFLDFTYSQQCPLLVF